MSAERNGFELRAKRKEPQCDSEESLDEFLEHELVCWLNEDKPICAKVATLRPELYGELNHLFDVVNEADNRCVEEILHEAELLMEDATGLDRPHSPFQWNEPLPELDAGQRKDSNRNRTIDKCLQTINPGTRTVLQTATIFSPQSIVLVRMLVTVRIVHRKDVPVNGAEIRRLVVPVLDQFVRDVLNFSPRDNTSSTKDADGYVRTKQGHSPLQRIRDLAPAELGPTVTLVDQPPAIKKNATPQPEPPTNPAGRRSKQEVPRRQTCDKSTQPSPTHEQPDRWSKDRQLELKITVLEDRLKDTEERYQSLRLQYDTLSQVHRTLRDSYATLQEESEMMQFDIRHLTSCAEVLRSELQSARCDRDSAIELQKLLQTELDESRKDRKKLQDGSEKDVKTIQDLQRQCREMERIMMRKNPDSISALIVASKSPTGTPPGTDSTSSTCRVLEQRIAQLEADARKQDAKAQGILADVQARFNSVQAKYETHIADLEMQVLSLQEINSKLNEKIIRQMEELASIGSHAVTVAATSTASFTQTDGTPPPDDVSERTRKRDPVKMRSILVQTDPAGGEPVTTVRSAPNAKRAQAQSKEDAHLLATIRGMRVDLAIKEKAVQRLTREVEECKKTIKKLQKKKDPIPGKGDVGRSPARVRSKTGDTAEPDTVGSLREAQSRVKALEIDYKTLQEKRMQDLKTLQAAHEKELASCHESIRFLQQRMAESEEELLHRKDKQRPGHNTDYYGLKAKRKRTLKRIVSPTLILTRKFWLSGTIPSCKELIHHSAYKATALWNAKTFTELAVLH
ncbi:centrosomal protein of 162 kDa-like [Anopheles nili]|uniref:centrosomal protein of 162 kDa-like n=1 Tax=Anopheles nili TaxID=185578 RepID=UPI00237C3141|nr:centrosomal protein of 162 kDa-like [Anopheles nili]